MVNIIIETERTGKYQILVVLPRTEHNISIRKGTPVMLTNVKGGELLHIFLTVVFIPGTSNHEGLGKKVLK